MLNEIIDVLVNGFDVSRNSLALTVADVIVPESQNVCLCQSFSHRMIISYVKKWHVVNVVSRYDLKRVERLNLVNCHQALFGI